MSARARDPSAATPAVADTPYPRLGWGCMLVALLVFSTLATFRRRDVWELFQGSGMDQEIKFKIAVWMILGLVAGLHWRAVIRNSHLLFVAPLAFYTAYWFLALVSATYSLEPGLTLFRAGQIGVALALWLAIAERIDRWPTLAIAYLSLNWAFLLIGLTGHPESLHWRVLPSYQEEGYDGIHMPWRFGTPIGHFSQISIVATLVVVSVVARLRGPVKVGDVLLLGWLLLTIVLAASRTAIAGLLAGLFLVLALRGMLALVALVGTGTVAALLALPPVTETVVEYLERGQDADDLVSLTNRTSVYESALGSIADSWPLGYGFRAARAAVLSAITDSGGNVYGASHAHNAVLESAIGLGAAGGLMAVLLLVALLGCGVGLLLRSRVDPASAQGVEFVGLFAPILAFSLLDSSFALEVGPFTLSFIAILVHFARCRATLAGTASPVAPRFHADPADAPPPAKGTP
jgi:exopolysaccharide production protein ExoQ